MRHRGVQGVLDVVAGNAIDPHVGTPAVSPLETSLRLAYCSACDWGDSPGGACRSNPVRCQSGRPWRKLAQAGTSQTPLRFACRRRSNCLSQEVTLEQRLLTQPVVEEGQGEGPLPRFWVPKREASTCAGQAEACEPPACGSAPRHNDMSLPPSPTSGLKKMPRPRTPMQAPKAAMLTNLKVSQILNKKTGCPDA